MTASSIILICQKREKARGRKDVSGTWWWIDFIQCRTLKRLIGCTWLSDHRNCPSVGDNVASLRSEIQLHPRDCSEVEAGLKVLFIRSPESLWRRPLSSSRGRIGQWPRAIHIQCLLAGARPGYSFSLREQTVKGRFHGMIPQLKENNMLSRRLDLLERAGL